MNTDIHTRNNRTFRKSALSQAILVACLIPTALLAQGISQEESTKSLLQMMESPDPDIVRDLTEVRSEVEFGGAYVSEDSFRFGKYTGLRKKDPYLLLDLDIKKRGPYDSDSTEYWRLQGDNLGLESRFAEFEYGRQGDFSTYILYDQIPVYHTETARTPFNGAGGGLLSLPPNWVAGQNTRGMPQLIPSLKQFDVEHDRKRVGVGFDKLLNSRWSVNTNYQYETKQGTKAISGVIGNTGGNPRAAILPEPIDYNEHKFDVALNYTTRKQQFKVAYYLSLFGNDQNSLTWQNPYSAINGWDPSAGFPSGQGRLALPPDNEYHQVTATYGNNLSDATRLVADFAYGIMTQDESLQPFTVNPALAASIVNPLPRSSLDGEIRNLLLNLQIASRPTPKLHWKGQLRYEDRDNKTPRDAYNYIGGDSQRQDFSLDGGRIRLNEPYSREELKVALDGGYRVASRTELSGGLEFRRTDRTFTEREEADDKILRLGAQTRASTKVSALLRYERSDRDGSTYIGEEPFVSSNTPEAVAATPGGFENLPGLRKYYLADRVRDKVNLLVNYMPQERWNLGFGANYINDDYKESEFGLKESKIEQYTLDATYMATERTSVYGFANTEKFKSEQDGRAFTGIAKLAQSSDPRRNWNAKHRDDVDSFGIGFTHNVIKSKLDIGADYVYSKSTGKVDVTTGPALSSAPLPDLKTKLHSFKLYGDYKIKPDMFLRLRYWYEKYDSEDWAVDNVQPNTLANVITLGETSPDYDVHVIGLSLLYRFN